MKYIQAIMKDGSKKRFVDVIPDEFKGEVKCCKELTHGELFQVPEIIDNKIQMRDKTEEELATEKAARDAVEAEELRAKKIRLKIKIDAGNALGEDMSAEESELEKLGA